MTCYKIKTLFLNSMSQYILPEEHNVDKNPRDPYQVQKPVSTKLQFLSFQMFNVLKVSTEQKPFLLNNEKEQFDILRRFSFGPSQFVSVSINK